MKEFELTELTLEIESVEHTAEWKARKILKKQSRIAWDVSKWWILLFAVFIGFYCYKMNDLNNREASAESCKSDTTYKISTHQCVKYQDSIERDRCIQIVQQHNISKGVKESIINEIKQK
jgi:hypothetical protein